MDIDFKKLLDQDEEFRKYFEKVVVEFIIDSNKEFPKMAHGFYLIGMEPSKVVMFLKNMMR